MVIVVQKNLEVGEVLSVDMSSIVAVSATINVQVKYNGPMRRVVFGVNILLISLFLLPSTYKEVLLFLIIKVLK